MSLYDSTYLLIYSIVIAAILGAVFGSFLNCAAYRTAHKTDVQGHPMPSFLKGKSICPTCGHTLKALDLIPIFSWIFLGGKCRYCKTKVSPRYLIAELIMAAFSVACLLNGGFSWVTLRNWIFLCCLFTLSLVDLDIYEIPNWCIIVMIAAWGACVPLTEKPLQTLIDGGVASFGIAIVLLIISLIFDKILGKESLGGGDIKLFFVTGLYLGIIKTLFALLLACILGLVFAIIKKAVKGRESSEKEAPDACKQGISGAPEAYDIDRSVEEADSEEVKDSADSEDLDDGHHIPFGPAIALAAWVVLLWGQPLVDWYQSLLGL